ncbi:MAG: sugar phosphate isomerase/epimerase family protein [Thermomicrobiales bacterium]
MKIAIREGMTRGETLAERIAWLTSVGLDGVELHLAETLALPADEIVRSFANSPVSVAAIEGSPRLLNADPAERQIARETIRQRLDLAAALGAVGVLVVPQFGRTAALPDLTPLASGMDLERDLFIAQMRDLAPAARAAGVPIFLEPLNRYEAYIVNRLGQGVAIAEEVGPEVAIMADFFHMNIEEADIAVSLLAAAPRLVYVHVADSNRLQPGRGHLDFRPGFQVLKAIGYDAYLTIECRIDGPYDEAVRETAGLLRTWWEEA